MNKVYFQSCERRTIPVPPRHSEDEIQYLLKTEERILQLISTRASLPEVLNGICSALDYQIGNVVSYISSAEYDATSAADIAQTVALFGLFSFFFTGIVAEGGEELGSLEIYGCVPRSPSPREFQLIERAACLAAIAIERDMEAGHHARGNMLKWPVFRN